MKAGPDIAMVASLVGDPARSNMLTALMTGEASVENAARAVGLPIGRIALASRMRETSVPDAPAGARQAVGS